MDNKVNTRLMGRINFLNIRGLVLLKFNAFLNDMI